MNLGFEESFSYLFKERRWLVKFSIIFVVNFALVVFTLLANYFTTPKFEGALTIKELTTLDFSTAIVVAVSTVIVSILMVVFSTWYTYENTQAAIQKRSSKLIWEYSIVNTFKKVIKYTVVSLIYSMFAVVTLLIFIGIPIFVIATIIGTTGSSMQNTQALAATYGLLFILLCCFALLAILVCCIVFYVVTMPAYLRLIATDSFSEAFNIRSNLRIAKRYFWNFVLILVLVLVYSGIVGLISGFASIFASSISILNPEMGLATDVIIQIPLTIVSTFFSYFVYTRLLGNLYRGIIEKEEDLKFLR